jgi:alkanesulfonate monooxygenase SsuD/methylene tetrahydromethanopterin reductase-like flavin-dependent oxidoreductase (luciferase family)
MLIGIGLPASIPGVNNKLILDWARRADAGTFSSLGIIDRLVYSNLEPLITLAAVAGVTQRIRLMTTVLVAPLRNAGVLAKQAATLDALSGGRLTLGLGVGGREDDYRAASAAFKNRGKRFEEQLTTMRRIWSGQPFDAETGPIGPKPARQGGPEVLIGGYSPTAIQRVGRWGDGLILGGSGDAALARQFSGIAEQSWQAAGRSGKPRIVACIYYGLGPNAKERAGTYIRDYYAFMGQRADYMANAIPTTPEAVKEVMQAFNEVGIDELIFWPCISDLDQVDHLAELL